MKQRQTLELLIAQDITNKAIAERFSDNETLLHLAVISGDHHITEKILELPELDVNYQDEHGRTALMLAASRNDEAAVRSILNHHGTDASVAAGWWGRTALHNAAVHGYDNICRLLAQRWDGGLYTTDRDGKTPRDLARQYHKGAEEYLFSAMEKKRGLDSIQSEYTQETLAETESDVGSGDG